MAPRPQYRGGYGRGRLKNRETPGVTVLSGNGRFAILLKHDCKNFRFDPDAYRVPLAIYNRMSEGKAK